MQSGRLSWISSVGKLKLILRLPKIKSKAGNSSMSLNLKRLSCFGKRSESIDRFARISVTGSNVSRNFQRNNVRDRFKWSEMFQSLV